jgi:Tfp pilus assembly protein PilV
MKQKQFTSRFVFGRTAGRMANRPRKRLRTGLTISELLVATVIVVIVVLALGTVIADSVRGWHKTYDRVYANVRTDSFVARKAFDQVIRKATSQMHLVDSGGMWLEVYYYSTNSAPVVDRYARLYTASGALLVEHGIWTAGAKSALRTDIVCENVASCVFKADGRSAQMVLTLDDDSQNIVVVTSAVMHNGS